MTLPLHVKRCAHSDKCNLSNPNGEAYSRWPHCTCGNNPLDAEDFIRMRLPRPTWGSELGKVHASAREGVGKYLDRIKEAKAKVAGGYICGAPGTGKSCIAALIAKEARAWGYMVYFISLSELRDAIKDKRMFDGEQSVFERSRTVDFLILDDLRSEDLNERFNFTKHDIRNLIQNRRNAGLVTIVTSRLLPADLEEKDKEFQYDTTKKFLAPLKVEGDGFAVAENLFK